MCFWLGSNFNSQKKIQVQVRTQEINGNLKLQPVTVLFKLRGADLFYKLSQVEKSDRKTEWYKQFLSRS